VDSSKVIFHHDSLYKYKASEFGYFSGSDSFEAWEAEQQAV
jgi:hypothetical protein